MNTQEQYKDKTNEELLKLYKETGSLEVKQEIVMRYIYLVKMPLGVAHQVEF